jgi:hypothetical protein
MRLAAVAVTDNSTAEATLTSYGYSVASARDQLARARLTGASVARGVSVTYTEAYGYRVRRRGQRRARTRGTRGHGGDAA